MDTISFVGCYVVVDSCLPARINDIDFDLNKEILLELDGWHGRVELKDCSRILKPYNRATLELELGNRNPIITSRPPCPRHLERIVSFDYDELCTTFVVSKTKNISQIFYGYAQALEEIRWENGEFFGITCCLKRDDVWIKMI